MFGVLPATPMAGSEADEERRMGSPLHTHAGDKTPGDIGGNSRHDIVHGDPEGKIDLPGTGGDQPGKYGAGFYRHLASLHT
jgi:hypothetical protein